VDLHLPKQSQCSLEFLQQIIEGKKSSIERYKVKNVKIPTWPELSVARLLPDVLKDAALKDYFQDKYAPGKVPDRDYFWGVISAIKPQYY